MVKWKIFSNEKNLESQVGVSIYKVSWVTKRRKQILNQDSGDFSLRIPEKADRLGHSIKRFENTNLDYIEKTH